MSDIARDAVMMTHQTLAPPQENSEDCVVKVRLKKSIVCEQ